MRNIDATDLLKPSASEFAAISLIGIAIAGASAFANKFWPLSQIFFVCIWILVAAVLSIGLARSINDAWKAQNFPAKLFIVLLLVTVYLAALKPTSTGFVRHDEIYSWGMWGVQHALGQPIDLHYTGAAYPQLFAYEIASVFLAQGSHIPHFFAKLVLGLPSILILIVLGDFTAKSSSTWVNWTTLFVSFGALASMINILYWGYADPLASALLLTSLALILQYSRKPDQLRLFVLASFCALIASLTKQPGLIWCLASLPVAAVYGVWRLRWKKTVLIPSMIAALLGAIWPVFLAPKFISNQGVLQIVENNGGLLASLLKSSSSYIVNSPDFGILLFLPLFFVLTDKPTRVFWFCFVLPYLIIWFILGSYEKRHGMHVILASALLFAHGLIRMHTNIEKNGVASKINSIRWQTGIVGAALFVVLSSVYFAHYRHSEALQDGNRAIFKSQFGADSANIFDKIVATQQSVFTASNYQYGMLFNRVPLYRPDFGDIATSPKKLKNYLVSSQAKYTFTSGHWSYGPYSNEIERLVNLCPDTFKLLKKSIVQPHLSIYQIDQQSLVSQCNP